MELEGTERGVKKCRFANYSHALYLTFLKLLGLGKVSTLKKFHHPAASSGKQHLPFLIQNPFSFRNFPLMCKFENT